MSQFISLNQLEIIAEDAFLPALSSAALYGRGVFTTVAVYNSEPFQWKKHWERLIENSEKIRLNLSEYNQNDVKQNLARVIEKNKLTHSRARLTFFDEAPTKLWQARLKRSTSLLIITGELPSVSDNLSLAISDFRINSTAPLAGVKSCNYLDNVLSLENAKDKGFDEAIRLNERGEVVSASMANIFWIKDREIITPSLETGCLRGTTRSFVLENFTVKEKKANLAELDDADEIFLTSTGIGIANVKSFNKRTFVCETTNHIKEEFLRCCYSGLSVNKTSL
jgi:branched-subunit amino acid aminotransferase/4-amino-4-deoxychorismate lyase